MKKEVRIGIYAVVIILLAWAGVRFLSGLQVFGGGAVYTAYYEDADGLKPASPVMIRGVKVGQITELAVDPDDPGRVRAVMTLPRQYRLPSDSEARIFSDGLLGGKAISIDYGTSPEMLESGDEIRSRADAGLFSAMESTVEELKAKVTEVMERLNSTLQSIQTLADDARPGLKRTLDHAGSIAARIDGSTLVGDLASITHTISGQGPQIEAIVGDVRRLTDTLASTESIAALKHSVENLEGILSKIGRGEGTVGKMVTDRELYDSAAEASRNLASLLADLQANPSRYVNIRVFGKTYEEKIKDREARKKYKAEQKAERKAERRDGRKNR